MKQYPRNIHSFGQRLIDRFLGVDPSAILNPVPVADTHGNLAAELMLSSRALISSGVDPHTGRVDYASLRQSHAYAEFRQLTRSLVTFQLNTLGHGAACSAFWLNIYNALIIDAIIQYQPQNNLLSQPGLFRQAAYNINGLRFSADAIEHGILRQNRRHPILPLRSFATGELRLAFAVQRFDARIHFALVCGARSCPPIAHYDANRLDAQLDQAAASFINGGGAEWDPAQETLWLSKIFKWYAADFGGKDAMLGMVRAHTRDEGIRNLSKMEGFKLRYRPYDWGINRAGAEVASPANGQ